jgi:DnaJ-class molecular chaperone
MGTSNYCFLGHAIYDSLKTLGLSFGASERDVKMAYQNLARIYHPDIWEESHHLTGMSVAETTMHFQLLNNAQSNLRQVL